MHKGRLEAFSDGVIAIIITIMVLEFKVPSSATWSDLIGILPVFLTYILSFVFVGIYWNNHHHLLQSVSHVTGGVLWANLHLLFWLTMIPFASGWMSQNHFSELPVALYGVILLFAAIAYWILTHCLLATHGPDSKLARALGRDFKGLISVFVYLTAIPLAFVNVWFACGCYVVVAIAWLVPDRRIERHLRKQ